MFKCMQKHVHAILKTMKRGAFRYVKLITQQLSKTNFQDLDKHKGGTAQSTTRKTSCRTWNSPVEYPIPYTTGRRYFPSLDYSNKNSPKIWPVLKDVVGKENSAQWIHIVPYICYRSHPNYGKFWFYLSGFQLNLEYLEKMTGTSNS